MIKLLFALTVALVEIIFTCLGIMVNSASGLFAIARVWLLQDYDYRRWLKRDLADCDVILELGCGANSPLVQIGVSHRTDAFDIWQPYVDMHNRTGAYRHCYQADILKMGISAKYDAVVICDVLEHLPKDEVDKTAFFPWIEGIATKKVILFTPNGFIENDLADDDPYQAHLSAWEPEDYLQRGYKVVGATGLRWLFGKASQPRYWPHAICAIIGMITKPFVFHRPNLACHSYAVKEL